MSTEKELRSCYPKVDSPEGVREDLIDSPDDIYTLSNMANLLLRDVMLVNLRFHMCSHSLSVLIPSSQA